MSEKEFDNLRKRFGQAVRRRRRDLDLTQEDLAEKAAVHRTYIANVERGEINLSLEKVAKIAQALDLTISELLIKYEVEE